LEYYVPENIEVFGDGDKSEIKNINPSFSDYYKGVIFYTTTYGPNNFNGIMKAPTHTINNAKKGQNFVVGKDITRRWAPGDIIGLGANLFYKKEVTYRARYSEFELNEISKVNHDTIFLKYPLSINLQFVEPEEQKDAKDGMLKKQKKAPPDPEKSSDEK
jgi:hypothetical protein